MTKFMQTVSAFIFFVAANSAYGQSITADLAKNCRAQAIKAYPTPIAGTKPKGVEKSQRDFFQACVAKGADNKQKN
jgi:hypothetical protein